MSYFPFFQNWIRWQERNSCCQIEACEDQIKKTLDRIFSRDGSKHMFFFLLRKLYLLMSQVRRDPFAMNPYDTCLSNGFISEMVVYILKTNNSINIEVIEVSMGKINTEPGKCRLWLYYVPSFSNQGSKFTCP